MRYSLYFWISGSAFQVSGVLKAQSGWKSCRVRDTRDLRTVPLQQGMSLSDLAARVQWLMSGVRSQWQSWDRSAAVQFPGLAVPEQNNLVPNAYLCLHCTTCLGDWKLYVSSTTAKACACPQCLCACLWEGVCICGCHCFPGFFMLRLYRSNSPEGMGEIYCLWEECLRVVSIFMFLNCRVRSFW